MTLCMSGLGPHASSSGPLPSPERGGCPRDKKKGISRPRHLDTSTPRHLETSSVHCSGPIENGTFGGSRASVEKRKGFWGRVGKAPTPGREAGRRIGGLGTSRKGENGGGRSVTKFVTMITRNESGSGVVRFRRDWYLQAGIDDVEELDEGESCNFAIR